MAKVSIVKKRIKHINLRMDINGNVTLSAPMSCPMPFIERYLQEKEPWIVKHRARLQARQLLLIEQPPLDADHKVQMHALLPGLSQKWEPIIGVQVNEWVVRLMKTRWGSCHPVKKKICLNLRLIQKPLVCLEYVLVHEMVHLLEPSHNKRFHALMSRFLPNWMDCKKQLNNLSCGPS